MIKAILWDVDGTLLDFLAAEREALRECFRRLDFGECTDAMIARYSEINKRYWKRLEDGEITKKQVQLGRFQEFFRTEGLDVTMAQAFNQEYQVRLSDTIVFLDNAYELVQGLRSRVKQYAVTNGTAIAQERKLQRSGLDQLLDGVFISDHVGAEKPRPEFFQYVFEHIESYAADEILIVGDSINSDIRGGNEAGIRCCWYNPAGLPVPEGIRVDYDIRNLAEVPGLLAQ